MKYIIQSEGDASSAPVSIIVDILDFPGAVNLDVEQDRQILANMAYELCRTTVKVWTKEEFDVHCQEMEKLKKKMED